jgi:UPF0755 protein
MHAFLVRALLLLLALAALAAAIFYWQYRLFLATPLEVGETGVILDVPRGNGLRHLSDELATRGLIDSPDLLVLYGRLNGMDTGIKAGEYRIEPGTTPPRLLRQLLSGQVVLHPLTLVEGWNFAQALAVVRATPELTATLDGLDGEAVMARLGEPGIHPEGLFFPDTYHFPRGTTDLEFLRRARATMREVLAAAWERRAEGLPFDDPYQALVLASIVEKETSIAAERPEVAGVFVRRLQKGMRLQALRYPVQHLYPGRAAADADRAARTRSHRGGVQSGRGQGALLRRHRRRPPRLRRDPDRTPGQRPPLPAAWAGRVTR